MPIPEALRSYASKLGFPDSERLARIFEILFKTEEELLLAGSMPGTAEELAGRTGLPEERVKELAGRLYERGAVSRPMNEPNVFRLYPAMIELRDASVLWPGAPQELFALWDRLVMEETRELVPVFRKAEIPPMMRVVPIERSVEAQNTVLDVDSARKIFKEAELISVIPCVCRMIAKKNGRGEECPAPETAFCMQTNRFAESILNRGIGERISNEEALDRIKAAEEAGLVHTVRNNIKKDMFMCNCCACCCTGLFFIHELGYAQGLAPSRFRVGLEEDACSGCGTCEERCQFHAIEVDDVAHIDTDRCYGCGNCVIACPEEALTLEEVRPKEHIRVK
jgi:NAD-dependent dihydropyrimidine dehydrogenase PreA subunit